MIRGCFYLYCHFWGVVLLLLLWLLLRAGFCSCSAASLAPAPALPVAPAFAPALALIYSRSCFCLLLLMLPLLLLLLLLLQLLLLLLLLLLLSLLLCFEGIWSLETLLPNSEQVLKGRDDFGRIRPNVFYYWGVFNKRGKGFSQTPEQLTCTMHTSRVCAVQAR